MQERLEVIHLDQHEYTLDEEDRKVQSVILKPEPSPNDTVILKKTLSCSYPDLPFKEAIKKENEKLQLELQHSQAHLDVSQCEVIQHLIDVTEAVAVHTVPEKSSPVRNSKKSGPYNSNVSSAKDHHDEPDTKRSDPRQTTRLVFCAYEVGCGLATSLTAVVSCLGMHAFIASKSKLNMTFS